MCLKVLEVLCEPCEGQFSCTGLLLVVGFLGCPLSPPPLAGEVHRDIWTFLALK